MCLRDSQGKMGPWEYWWPPASITPTGHRRCLEAHLLDWCQAWEEANMGKTGSTACCTVLPTAISYTLQITVSELGSNEIMPRQPCMWKSRNHRCVEVRQEVTYQWVSHSTIEWKMEKTLVIVRFWGNLEEKSSKRISLGKMKTQTGNCVSHWCNHKTCSRPTGRSQTRSSKLKFILLSVIKTIWFCGSWMPQCFFSPLSNERPARNVKSLKWDRWDKQSTLLHKLCFSVFWLCFFWLEGPPEWVTILSILHEPKLSKSFLFTHLCWLGFPGQQKEV